MPKTNDELTDLARYVERTYDLDDVDKLALAYKLIYNSGETVPPSVLEGLEWQISRLRK